MGHKLAEIQRIQSILVTIYLLELVGATAVTSLGWAACRMLQIDWIPSAHLWFAEYLLVYNLDRLYPDPADLINIPIRSSKTEELRAARIGLAFISAAVLLVWSLLTTRWWLVLVLAFAATILQFYSRPVPRVGFRLKDLPSVKSLLPPGAIAGILVVWFCVENGRSLGLKECLVAISKTIFTHQILSWFSLPRRSMICITEKHWTRLVQVFSKIQTGISNSTQYLPWKSGFYDLRTNFGGYAQNTGALADAERNALRAYLDEKGFKTAIIDDNLAIAGELTWKEVFEPVEGFYKGKADVYPF